MSDRPVRSKRSSTAAKKASAAKSAPAKRTATKRSPAKSAPESPDRQNARGERRNRCGLRVGLGTGTAPAEEHLRGAALFPDNDVPIYFFGATPFNLLGLDRWVRNFSYVTYYDAWDGAHPRVFTPSDKPYKEFESGEEINNWLLTNPEVRAFIDAGTPRGVRPKVAMVFFDRRPRKSATNSATT